MKDYIYYKRGKTFIKKTKTLLKFKNTYIHRVIACSQGIWTNCTLSVNMDINP